MSFDEGIKSVVQRLVVMALNQVADERGDWSVYCETDDYWAIEPMDGNKKKRIKVTCEYPPMATCSGNRHGLAVADDMVRFVILYPITKIESDRFRGRPPFWFESQIASSNDQQIASANLIAHVSRAIDSL
jgi:hypothetical protein